MILTSKVVLYTIYPFNIDNGYNFTFSYQGAENVDGNILKIYAITDMKNPIITQIQDGTKLNTLTKSTAKTYKMKNGEKYCATISMTSNNEELTNTCSDPVYFYCFTTPTLSFKNTEIFQQPIKNSSFIVELDYQYDKTGTYQDELNEYKVVVYPYADDINQLTVYETKRALASDLNNLTAYITDLDAGQSEAKSYYLKALGITKFGVTIESSLLKIDIQNTKQYIKTAFNAEVNNTEASIYLSSNLINIDGEQYGDVSFDDGQAIVGKNGVIYFKKDISVESVESSVIGQNKGNNFMLSLKFSDFPIDSNILVLKNKKGDSIITLSAVSNKIHSFTGIIRDTDPKGIGILKLTALDSFGENIIRSNSLNLNYINNENICKVKLLVIIERIKGAYNLKVKIIE